MTLDEEVERLYEDTRAAIRAYLLCLGISTSQAPELTQETFLRLYQTMRKGETIENVRAWLFRVAHNLGVAARAKEWHFSGPEPDWERMKLPAGSPEQMLIERERLANVQAAILQLSPQQKNCLYLRAEGLRYREIAGVLGISISAVGEFLRRAVEKLGERDHG
jgi:RNA polymerase sigma-70 factor (ECF subfamily)